MAEEQQAQASPEEQVGFHKGSLSTLAKEREELARILGIVEQLMQMHIGALKELGIDLEADAAAAQAAGVAQPAPQPDKKKPIEDIL